MNGITLEIPLDMPVTHPTGSLGVIVARFQTPCLHAAHLGLFKTVMGFHKKVAVVLGQPSFPSTRHDPLDYETRKLMLLEAFPNLTVLSVSDQKFDDMWSANVDTIIRNHFPFDTPVLYGGRDSFLKHYCGKLPTAELMQAKDFSGTEYRFEAAAYPLQSEDFRRGVIYGIFNNFPRVRPTVDAAITKIPCGGFGVDVLDGEILLCRKPHDRNQWGFVGGFADVNSPSYESDVAREVEKEVGCEIYSPTYVTSALVKDWRTPKDSQESICTVLFHCEYMRGPVTAMDDISAVKWFILKDLYLDMIVDAHKELMKDFFKYITEDRNYEVPNHQEILKADEYIMESGI